VNKIRPRIVVNLSNLFAVFSGYMTLKQGPNLGYWPKNGVRVGLSAQKRGHSWVIGPKTGSELGYQPKNGFFLYLCSSQMVHSPNGTFAKWFIRQLVHSPNGTFAKWHTPPRGHYSLSLLAVTTCCHYLLSLLAVTTAVF
jgi:hypothetical protein